MRAKLKNLKNDNVYTKAAQLWYSIYFPHLGIIILPVILFVMVVSATAFEKITSERNDIHLLR